MKDFSKNILGKIKKEQIKPISKWNFVFKKSFMWSLFIISVILGGFAFGSILAQINATEWDIHHHVSESFPNFIFLMLPYVWIIFMLGFSALAYYYLRHTSKGYRYSTIIVINSSLLISVILGTILFATGVSNRMEYTFEDRIPFYNKVMNPRTKIWMLPEKGLLAGKIIEIENQKKFKLEDLKKDIWTVEISDLNLEKNQFIQKNIRVKVIGTKNGNLFFIAEEIRPWRNAMKDMCEMQNPKIPCPKPPIFFQKKMKENPNPLRTTK